MISNYSVVGKRIPRVDSYEKVTGKGVYTGDIKLPNMLYGKILRSPYPHARILNIDVTKAKKLKGIKGIVTGKDTLKIKYGVISRSPKYMDKYPLAVDKVRYIGDAVAAVAAISEDIAEEALELIKVDYEILPGVFDPEEAMNDGAPIIHEGFENNISRKFEMNFGDIDKTFRDAHLIQEDRFVTQSVIHAPMEPHAALANYDSSKGLTLWTSTQTPYYVKIHLSLTLGIPEGKIRVIKPYVGGGFGGKADGMSSLDFSASLLSIKTALPVSIAYSREEEFTATRRRHPIIIHLKTAVKKDGTILGRFCKAILDGGAYNSYGPLTLILCGNFFNLPYRMQSYRYEGYRVYTNKPPCGAMRGHSSPQVHFASEVQMDIIAERLRIDPAELRIKNGLKAGDIAPNGFKIMSSGFDKCIKLVEQEDLSFPKEAGLGCGAFPSGAGFYMCDTTYAHSSASVKIHEDGTATIFTGASDIGQGSETIFSQIVAEELGIPLNTVRIMSADTELTPPDMGTYSSRVTVIGGNAVLSAVRNARRELLKIVGEKLEVAPEDLILKNGRIFVKGSPEKGISISEGVKIYQREKNGMEIIGKGVYNSPDKHSPTYSFGAQKVIIDIDKDTGIIKVLNVNAAHDCGFPINPIGVEGQLEGSIHMGLGYALFEKLYLDRGQTMNPSFLHYKIPTSLEMPDVKLFNVEVIDPEGPFGAKESGEGTVGPTAPAIANAIYNNIGIRFRELPIDSEKIVKGLSNE